MNTPELQVGGGLLLIILLCYAAGRLHQWARSSIDRDQAYREGYDDAARSLFHLATRVTQKINAARGPHTKEIPAVMPQPIPITKAQPSPRRQPMPDAAKQRRARHAA